MPSIKTFFLGPLGTGSYLVINEAASQAVAIDLGGDPGDMTKLVEQQKLTLTHILLTHLHFDHTMGVAEMLQQMGTLGQKPEVLLHTGDDFLLQSTPGMPDVSPFPFSPLTLGKQSFAGLDCTVLHTPGHTPGGVSYYFPELKAVFVGDALFQRSIGRTDFPGGDTDTLYNSIRTQLYSLPEDTVVYPGHGPETSIADEKRMNPFVRG